MRNRDREAPSVKVINISEQSANFVFCHGQLNNDKSSFMLIDKVDTESMTKIIVIIGRAVIWNSYKSFTSSADDELL